jgi:hypothetical protein
LPGALPLSVGSAIVEFERQNRLATNDVATVNTRVVLRMVPSSGDRQSHLCRSMIHEASQLPEMDNNQIRLILVRATGYARKCMESFKPRAW